jgi:hypothetical protein
MQLDLKMLGEQIGDLVADAVEPLQKRINVLESRQLERGEKGEPGDRGEPGLNADPVSVPDVVAELLATDGLKALVDLYVAEAVAKHFEDNPVQQGKDGAPGDKGDPGDRGEKGLNGADGVGLASAMIDRDGQLVVTKTNGESIALGAVIGKDGAPGKDGSDGADFSDAELDYDGERGLIIRGKGGELVKRMPIPIYRGYWREGMKAEQGDILTCEGNAWIAKKECVTKPCLENDSDWRLFARKGRDGPQGPAGKDYKPPEPVKLS